MNTSAKGSKKSDSTNAYRIRKQKVRLKKKVEQEFNPNAQSTAPPISYEHALKAARENILSRQEFMMLSVAFEHAVKEHRAHSILKRSLKQDAAAGRTRAYNSNKTRSNAQFTSTSELLLLCLRRWKLRLTQKKLGELHQLTQPKVSEWLKQSIPWMQNALGSLAQSDHHAPQELVRKVAAFTPLLSLTNPADPE